MRNNTDIASGVFLLAFVAFGFSLTATLPPPPPTVYFGPAFFPNLVLTLLGLCALALTIRGMKKGHRRKSAGIPRAMLPTVIRRTVVFVAAFGLYVFLFFQVGYLISTLVFMIAGQYIFGRKRHVQIAAIAVLAAVGSHQFFTTLFNVPLP